MNETPPAAESAAESSGSSSSSGVGQASSTSSSTSSWYLSESMPSFTSKPSHQSKTRTIPNPPNTLPSYLLPLWNHIYESPFLDQETINFINSKAVQENVSIDDMDASVSNWVDWVIVASLRNGRERGIRGASEGVKTAVSFDTYYCYFYLYDVQSANANLSGFDRCTNVSKSSMNN